MSPLGPIKPIKRPKPVEIAMANGNFAYLDAEDNFESGINIYVCTQEDPAIFDDLESGTYTTEANETVIVIDGVIDEISS